MITENLSTLKIHKLTQAQYDRELVAGRLDENALYLTPDEEIYIEVDTTLSQSGKAADAKAVGDRLTTLETSIPSVEGLATEEYVDNAIDNINVIIEETDPTVPAWAKASTKPSYTASEVGALPNTTVIPSIDGLATTTYVDSKDSEILADAKIYTNEQIASIPAPDVSAEIDAHDSSTGAHSDIREQIEQLSSVVASKEQLTPEFANSIEECTDTTKLYVLPDGMIYAYMKTVIPGGEPLFTNALDSVDVNINQRWSHSSKKYIDASGYMVTGLIPVTADQVVYVNREYKKGGRNVFTGGYSRVTYYNISETYVSGEIDRALWQRVVLTSEDGVTRWTVGYTMTKAGDVTTNARMASADDIVYMRLVFDISDGTTITEDDVADIIVSVGNPIVYSEASEGYTWASTGHAFVPADYEGRIIAVENTASKNTARIVALEKSVESGGADETEEAALSKIQKWDKPVYDPAPVTLIADSRVKPALTTNDRTIDAIYAKYRALMAAHPDYITETNMGKSSESDTFTAVDMLRYDFKERDGLASSAYNPADVHETKPKIILMSGVHTEWVGVWGLYYALEEITTNPDFDDIRRNAHIIVIPCSNPYCLTSQTAIDGWRMSHVNANGVAIHNNFGVDHSTSGSVGEYNYGGSAPYSEPETQYIDAVMAENPDAVAFVSCHNNDYSTIFGAPVIWASSATYHMCNLTFRLVDKLTKAWLDKYGHTLKDSIDQYKINMDTNDYRLGRATMSTSKGTEQKNATKYGIMGVNLEISRMMKVFSGNTDGSSEVMTHGAEVYANFMRTLLATYDHKDKKEYAPNLPWSE